MRIIKQWFATHLRGWLAWSLIIVGVGVMYTSMFRVVANMKGYAIQDMPKAWQDAFNLSDISNGPNYIQGTITGFIGLILLAIAGISWAAGALAGDEESGDLALTLAHGVSRSAIHWWRLVAVVLAQVVVALLLALGIIALNDNQNLQIEPAHALLGTLAMLALVLVCSSAAWLVGAITGRKSWAIIAGAAVLVVSWVANSLGGQAGLAWLRDLSPLHWAFADEPLRTGRGWPAIIILLATSAVLWVIGWAVFTKRDVNG